MSRENQAETLDGWDRLSTSMGANPDQFVNLENERQLLVSILHRSRDLVIQQAALTASKQDVSKRLEALLEEGRKLATFLRVGVKQKLGNRSELLIEFGLRPFRSRFRKPTPPPQPELTAPAAPSPVDSQP
ncbi:MAG: hypothetical protein ABUL63_00495 [Acidobacteriota bacterium]